MSDHQISIKERLDLCYNVNGGLSFKKISGELLNDIEKETSFLDDYNPSIGERVYCMLNNIGVLKRCPITGEKLKYSPNKKCYNDSKTLGYSKRIIKNKPNVKLRLKLKSEDIAEKYKNSEFNLLHINDCIRKYNDICKSDNANLNPDIAHKNIDLTCSIIHYTNFLGVGVGDFSERVYCMSKGIQSLIVDRDGIPLKFINNKVGYSKFSNKQTRIKNILDDISEEISKKFEIYGFDKDNGKTNRIHVRCKKCNYKFDTFFKNGLWKNIYCAGCYGDPNRSKGEMEIVEYLKSIGVENIIENDRKTLNGLELDIYCPEYKVAIEYCGILWHSFGSCFPTNDDLEKSNKFKHFEKYKLCKNLGIRLITIFENEWKLKNDIVRSILGYNFKLKSERIYARKCNFIVVDKEKAKEFLEDNHIQGSCNFTNSYGLFNNGELVSLMTFGKRGITRGLVRNELIRFCNKKYTTVVGGASKLLKNSGESSFISYCDVRYGSGGLYEKLGMRLSHHSKPNYYYTRNGIKLYHRSNFQKHKIKKDDNDFRTEREIMYSDKYRRIYDCGNLVFEI